MAFIDEIKLELKAGRGGDGVERWRHEKGREFMGPSGGDGGHGGNVYIRGKIDSMILRNYAHKKKMQAGNGEAGSRDSLHGKNGEDLYVDVPVGSFVKNLETGQTFDILKPDEEILILKGGQGGFGNEHFKASTNTTPTETTPGKPGEEADFLVEINLIADAGLIGFPNAGKSTLLNALTNAKSKVAPFAFTTLEPHLGRLYEFTLADIPGLIEGASEGKGIGHKFLKHIKRTKILLHCIASDSEDVLKDYETIRKELSNFSPDLVDKKEIVILTKIDEISEKDLAKKKKDLEKGIKKISKDRGEKSGVEKSTNNIVVLTSTILDDKSIKDLSDYLTNELRKS